MPAVASGTVGGRAGSGRSIDRSIDDRSIGRSVGGAYLLAGMRARKWRAGKNDGEV